MMNFIVFLLFFVFIFGPTLDLGVGQISDVSFLLSSVIVLYTLVVKGWSCPSYVYRPLVILVCILFLSILNTTFFDMDNIHIGYRAIFRPIRIAVIFLSGYFLVRYIVDFYREKYFLNYACIYHKIVWLVFLSIGVHAILMVAQFAIPELRGFVYEFTFAKEQLEYNKMFRMAGLSGGGGAQISYVQGLGGLIGFYLLFLQEGRHKGVALLFIIAITFSIILSGRSGFIPLVLGLLFYSSIAAIRLLMNLHIPIRVNLGIMLILAAATFLIPLFSGVFGDNSIYLEIAVRRTFKTLINFNETGNLEDDTVSALLEMFIIPNEWAHLLFGKSSYIENNTYYEIWTDIGYFRVIWSYGLIGLFFYVFFYLMMALKLLPSFFDRRYVYVCSLPLFMVLLVYIMNLKEIFFMSKFSFQINILIYFSYIILNFKKRDDCGEKNSENY
ncbi:hypothetical protein ACVBEJ_03120 [Porticoccus sp. GXU_MW_L64]